MKKNDTFPLEITAISSDGNGVGRADGMAIFVPFSAVGDKLTVRAEKVQERYAFARITEIDVPSADRVQADCPQFTRCGGCALRHISYEAELAAKQQMAQDAITRLGGFSLQAEPILASPVENFYRNKVQFPVAQNEQGLYPGFYAARSHRVVDIARVCKLQDPVLGEIA
ncbi:MAG: class I SAM-dependent RNA methyltransferase, partial [Oscillospiraceae bacterium]|nr:class I SAM-dependent RNA methyltransferase [Oscillospiraceae bacterium]